MDLVDAFGALDKQHKPFDLEDFRERREEKHTAPDIEILVDAIPKKSAILSKATSPWIADFTGRCDGLEGGQKTMPSNNNSTGTDNWTVSVVLDNEEILEGKVTL